MPCTIKYSKRKNNYNSYRLHTSSTKVKRGERKRQGKKNLAKSAVEDEGIFAFDLLNEIRDFIQESVAGKVKGTSYMAIVGPLIIPEKPESDQSPLAFSRFLQQATMWRSNTFCWGGGGKRGEVEREGINTGRR